MISLQGVSYTHFEMEDTTHQDIKSQLNGIYLFIDDAINRGDSVLVVSDNGMSRSPAGHLCFLFYLFFFYFECL